MASRKKSPALAWVCQSKEQVMQAIRELGDAQRELVRLETGVNDAIAEIVAASKDEIEAHQTRIETLYNGIQPWCEARRAVLLAGGGKEANLVTGLVKWRQRPPRVSIRAADKVIETLRALGLSRFIRSKDEPNKEAMLAEPNAVAGIAGISIVSGVEDFVVEPFEVEVVT